jgi:hypothetical protein
MVEFIYHVRHVVSFLCRRTHWCWCSCPTTGISDKHLSLVDTRHLATCSFSQRLSVRVTHVNGIASVNVDRLVELLSYRKSYAVHTRIAGLTSTVCHFLSTDLSRITWLDSLIHLRQRFLELVTSTGSLDNAVTGVVVGNRVIKIVSERPGTIQYDTTSGGARVSLHDLTVADECPHYIARAHRIFIFCISCGCRLRICGWHSAVSASATLW